MGQRIAKKTVGGVSVWDVHVEVKDGFVDYTGDLAEWLARMLSDWKSSTLPAGLTWDKSLKALLVLFQKHIDDGSSIFNKVLSLHYLKFSLLNKKNDNGDPRYFFCFCTQFDDPGKTPDEQRYIDDMYMKYGALMEVVWHHCKGVTDLLEVPVTLPKYPTFLIPKRPGGFKLSKSFLGLIDGCNVDRDVQLCFYNSNLDASSENVKTWRKDSDNLGKVATEVAAARVNAAQTGANVKMIFSDLMAALKSLGV